MQIILLSLYSEFSVVMVERLVKYLTKASGAQYTADIYGRYYLWKSEPLVWKCGTE